MKVYNNTTKEYDDIFGYDEELYTKLSTPVKVCYPPYHLYNTKFTNKYKLVELINQDSFEIIISFNTWRSSYYNKFTVRKRFGNVFELFNIQTGRAISYKEIYPLKTSEYHLLEKPLKDIEAFLKKTVYIQVNYASGEIEFVDYSNKYNVVHLDIMTVNSNTLALTQKEVWSNIRDNMMFKGEEFMGEYEVKFIKDYFPKIAEFYQNHYLFRS